MSVASLYAILQPLSSKMASQSDATIETIALYASL